MEQGWAAVLCHARATAGRVVVLGTGDSRSTRWSVLRLGAWLPSTPRRSRRLREVTPASDAADTTRRCSREARAASGQRFGATQGEAGAHGEQPDGGVSPGREQEVDQRVQRRRGAPDNPDRRDGLTLSTNLEVGFRRHASEPFEQEKHFTSSCTPHVASARQHRDAHCPTGRPDRSRAASPCVRGLTASARRRRGRRPLRPSATTSGRACWRPCPSGCGP